MGRKKKRLRLLARMAKQATKTEAPTPAPPKAADAPAPPKKAAAKPKKKVLFKNLDKKTDG